MPSFTFDLNTIWTNDPNPVSFRIVLKPEHTATLAHAIELSGTFSKEIANGYALLDYTPCWHLAEFRENRLTRFLRLNRANLRLAFGPERGDRHWQTILFRRRFAR
ncbi:hypothetical protein THIOKS1860008 [Thiocapsa sp. KS1]|nr:hypothetical protein [Thiocapsa sp. KS1]CRI67839.1 hypothetical protein THIOKS1860008 [Thiocapsa sp. KS1]